MPLCIYHHIPQTFFDLGILAFAIIDKLFTQAFWICFTSLLYYKDFSMGKKKFRLEVCSFAIFMIGSNILEKEKTPNIWNKDSTPASFV